MKTSLASFHEEIHESLKVIVTAYELYGLKLSQSQKTKLIKKTMKYFIWMLPHFNNDWIALMKYKLAAFYSAHHQDTIPPFPKGLIDKPDILLPGCGYRFVHKYKNTESPERVESFLFTILQLKKGMPRPDKEAIERSMVKTVKSLCTLDVPKKKVRVANWSDSEQYPPNMEYYLTEEQMVKELERTVDEIFPDTTKHTYKQTPERPYAPSFNATYAKSRRGLGQFGALLDTNAFYNNFIRDPIKVVNVTPEKSEEFIEDEENPQLFKIEGGEYFRTDFKKFYDELFDECDLTDTLVEPVGLPEPLKVRVISKGPGVLYFLLKPLQVYMLDVLRIHPTFQLVGSGKVTKEILLSQLGKPINYLKKGHKYLSIDYKAATDGMKNIVTETLVKRICKNLGLGERLSQMFMLSLTGHTFDLVEYKGKTYTLQGMMDGPIQEYILEMNNPGAEKPVVTTYNQQKGQLMGSVTSFPILNLANATICRIVKERESGRRTLLAELPLLINGDDAVMPCKNSTKAIWENVAGYFGMEPSIGKVLFKNDILNINSTLFTVSDFGFELVPYVNFGLIKGLKRSEGGETKKDAFTGLTIGARHRALKQLTPTWLWEKVNILYHVEHFKVLHGNHLPWYIDESLGGYGLVGTPTVKDMVTARAIKNGMAKTRKPRFAKEMSEIVVKDFVDHHYLGDVPRRYSSIKPAEEQNDETSLLYIAAIYYHPDGVVKELDKNQGLRLYKRNNAIWKSAQKAYGKYHNLKPYQKTVNTVVGDDLMISTVDIPPGQLYQGYNARFYRSEATQYTVTEIGWERIPEEEVDLF